MKNRPVMSAAAVEAHQKRHGFTGASPASPKASEPVKIPKPRQNKTEAEYGMILEAQKRKGEILDYRPFGIKLEWGANPVTGKPMVYSPDFLVFRNLPALSLPLGAGLQITIIEVKGEYIHPQDWIRFKGCWAAWPMFRFELWQKRDGCWLQLL